MLRPYNSALRRVLTGACAVLPDTADRSRWRLHGQRAQPYAGSVTADPERDAFGQQIDVFFNKVNKSKPEKLCVVTLRYFPSSALPRPQHLAYSLLRFKTYSCLQLRLESQKKSKTGRVQPKPRSSHAFGYRTLSLPATMLRWHSGRYLLSSEGLRGGLNRGAQHHSGSAQVRRFRFDRSWEYRVEGSHSADLQFSALKSWMKRS